MAYRRGEAWWDYSWNVVGGCLNVSPGCKNCYAAYEAGTRQTRHRIGLYENTVDWVRGKPVFNGNLTVCPPDHDAWTIPLRRSVQNPVMGAGKPPLIFVGDMSDLFHERRPDWIIDEVVATLAASSHIGLLLTKRVARLVRYLSVPRSDATLAHWRHRLWLGFSAEDQQRFDERWEEMRPLTQQGWTTFVSVAPLLAPVRLPADLLSLGQRVWVIVSGEQRCGASRPRPMDPAWARALRDQCAEASLPFFMLQMAGRKPIPPDLRIKQFPTLGDAT
jgi:protein gp37